MEDGIYQLDFSRLQFNGIGQPTTTQYTAVIRKDSRGTGDVHFPRLDWRGWDFGGISLDAMQIWYRIEIKVGRSSEKILNSVGFQLSLLGKDGYDWYNGWIFWGFGIKVTPWLYLNGVYYDKPPITVGNNLTRKFEVPGVYRYSDDIPQIISYVWTKNPQTNEAWDITGGLILQVGFRVSIYSYSQYAVFVVLGMTGIAITQDFIFTATVPRPPVMLPVRNETISLTQYTQLPIKADDLVFQSETPLSERTELVFLKHGVIVWRGISWLVEEDKNGEEFKISAKSQQILLDYRLSGTEWVPDVPSYHLDNALQDINDLFEDSCNPPAFGQFYSINSWKGDYYETLGVPTTGPLSIFVNHDIDTYIRPGVNPEGTRVLNTFFDFHGIASQRFSDFFKRLGMEIRYRYALDGYVYQDIGYEMANGSAANPLISFVDGQNNCHITKRLPTDPAPNAVIASSNQPKVSCSWLKSAKAWITKVVTGSRNDQDYLDSLIESDDTIYDIVTKEEHWHLRPGDYISVQPYKEGPRPVRIQQITTRYGETTIRAGKKLNSIDQQFGVWRDLKGSTPEYDKSKVTAISITGITGSTSFTVAAADVVRAGWNCVANINWELKAPVAPAHTTYNGTALEYAADGFVYVPPITLTPIGYGSPGTAYLYIWGIYSTPGVASFEFMVYRQGWYYSEPSWGGSVTCMQEPLYQWRKNGGPWHNGLSADYLSRPSYDMGEGLWCVMQVVPTFLLPQPAIEHSYTGVYGNQIIIKSTIFEIPETTIDDISKILVAKVNGVIVPPGRTRARSLRGSVSLDITSLCVSGTNTLAVALYGGVLISTDPIHPRFYHVLSGSIDQKNTLVQLTGA